METTNSQGPQDYLAASELSQEERLKIFEAAAPELTHDLKLSHKHMQAVLGL